MDVTTWEEEEDPVMELSNLLIALLLTQIYRFEDMCDFIAKERKSLFYCMTIWDLGEGVCFVLFWGRLFVLVYFYDKVSNCPGWPHSSQD